MVQKLGLIVGVPFLAVTLFLSATGIVLVDVREGDGSRIAFPVPLVLADAALTFAPEEAKRIECPEFGPYRDLALRVVRELRNVPDAVLVEVEEPGTRVEIRKKGDALVARVEDGEDRVHAVVPLRAVETLVRSYRDGEFSARAALAVLRHAPRGDVVNVVSGADRVRVWSLF